MEDKTVKQLRQFFNISVAAFEFMRTTSKALGGKGETSQMHVYHLHAKNEINKDNPDGKKIDNLLAMMEEEAERIKQSKSNP